MRINIVSSSPIFTSYKNDIEHMSGAKTSVKIANKTREYEKIQTQKAKADAKNIIPAVKALKQNGFYNSSILLFNNIKSVIGEENISEDLYNAAGESYMNMGDAKNAYKAFKQAKKSTPVINSPESVKIYRNYFLAGLLAEAQDIEPYNGPENIFTKMADYKAETMDLWNKDPQKAYDKLSDVFTQAAASQIFDIELNLDTAKALAIAKEYENSANLCRINLDILKNQNKVYTKEFYDNLLMLGSNYLNMGQTTADFAEAVNIIENAKQISKKIEFENNDEIAGFLILKGKSKICLPSEYMEILENFAENTKDKNLIKEAYLMSAKIKNNNYSKQNKIKFLQEAEKIAIEQIPNNQKELLKIYEDIIQLNPNFEKEYSKKITNLKDINYSKLSTKTFINLLYIFEEQGNNEGLMKLENSCPSGSTNNLIYNIHKYYSNIINGENFKNNAKNLYNTLNKLYYSSAKEDNNVKKELYKFYSKLSDEYYNSQDYYYATKCRETALKLSETTGIEDEEIAKNHIYNTLMNYKAGYYYQAQECCMDYLKFLLKKYEVKNIDIGNLTVNNLKNMNSERLVNNLSEKEIKNAASAIETLGILYLKAENLSNAEDLYRLAINIRQSIRDKDLNLANDYSALARILILRGIWNGSLDSKDYHEKCISILKNMKRNSVLDSILEEEKNFHNKYYGMNYKSALKHFRLWLPKKSIIEKFQCYNGELNICE